ncbi:MAG: MMPL family transporter [Pseudomonadales bacterium]
MLGALAVLLLVAGYYATQFSFDASSDTLVVRGDPELATYLRVSEQFGGDEFLLMTFRPDQGGALAPENLDTLARLSEDLMTVDGVAGVFSILDVPLLESPPLPIAELADGFRTLQSPGVDRDLARRELTGSPLFSELLITDDAETSALRIGLALDGDLLRVDRERAALRTRQRELEAAGEALSGAELARLEELEARHDVLRQAYVDKRERLIAEVRDIRGRYEQYGMLHLGGVPMIAADMVDFVKDDLLLFGTSVVVLIMGVLFAFFRRWRWVFLPILTSAVTVLYTVAILAAAQMPATVVSSNFMALLAIITISLTIHLIVRHRELAFREPNLSPGELVRETMSSKFAPCLYNALTTMAAFGSLMAARIVPVEQFGFMMVLGIGVGMFVTFTFFPAVLLLLPAGRAAPNLNEEFALTRVMGRWARWHYVGVTSVGAICALLAAYGISQVSMDNRFLEYFQEDTDIYQGMHFVDRNLGGTIPFDVVVRFEPYEPIEAEDDFFAVEEETYPERYWFTRTKLDRLLALHRYLDERPEVGKVLSVASLDLVSRRLTDGQPLSSAEIAGVLGALPQDLRAELIDPYADPSSGELRLNGRIVESGPSFDRAALVEDIRRFASEDLGFAREDVVVTGMMVMFDNMLKQLFSSQVDTLAYVLLAALVMFLILLRSVTYAILGVIPNVLAAAAVIAFMGYAGISLDMMTITIAAISVGIGVDDAIHYLHRFREERERDNDVRLAVAWSHATIGRAMYFTSLTIIVGFSVLMLSNFVPTQLFGLLTAVAMVLALVANLALLPSLLVLFLGPPRRDLPV